MVKKRMAMRMVTIFVALIVCGMFFPGLARGLSVPKLEENLGEVVVGESKVTSVGITNDGNHEFKIWLALNKEDVCTDNWTYTGPTMYPDSDPASSFGPGDTLTVSVTFTPSAVGECNAWLQITPLTGDPGVEIHFIAKGIEKPADTSEEIVIGNFTTSVKNRIIEMDGQTTSTLQEMIDDCEYEFETGSQRRRQLVGCIARTTGELKGTGEITRKERNELIRTALRMQMQRIIKKWKERKKRLESSRGGYKFWWISPEE